MALRGTLADMGIVDLIQFPHAGRKTGELIIVSPEDEARLYYDKGKLTHAALGDQQGEAVLVDVVDWSEGEFEFRTDVMADEQTVEADVHRALMQALKIRDERRMSADAEEGKDMSSDRLASALAGRLKQFLTRNDYARYACAMNLEGELLAEAVVSHDPPSGQERIRASLQALVSTYPRPGLQRVFLEDEEGTLVLHRLDERHALVVVADKSGSLGAVSMGVSKLADGLREETA